MSSKFIRITKSSFCDVGVDFVFRHESDHAVNHIQFLINEGGLITACANDIVHLWNYRQKVPEIVRSVQLNKESVSCIHLPMGSKWLYVGTDKVPFPSCPQQPQALAVLLKGELMMLDLLTPGYPCIESPHAMDLHEVPITCVAYYSDCASDLIGALTLVGCKQRRKGFSERAWPASGGIARECATGHQELILTGHKDGTVRFWQASGENLQFLYRLKTTSHFERLEEWEGCEKVSHAVKSIELCVE
ncbi:WD domain, G-beta repeat protein, partial [Teladorsagia circumcincta]